jgi:putative membrane protein
MLNFLLRLLITMVALKGADILLPNFNLHGGFVTIAIFSLVLGILNWAIKPILVFFSIPFIVVTLGLFYLIINALILYIASLILPGILTGTTMGYIVGSLFVSILHWMLSLLFRVHAHE